MPVERGFAESVERELGRKLADAGFAISTTSCVRVTYENDALLVSIAHMPEDAPGRVYIDLGRRVDASDRLVGLWRLLPKSSPALRYTAWTFSDDAELAEVLRKVEAEVLPVALQLVEAEDLEAQIAQQDDEAESRYLEDRRMADLEMARRAFTEERWQDAVDRWVLLEDDALSARDRRQLFEARKRLRESGGQPR